MFNKILLASITLDKKKLKKGIDKYCIAECIPTIKLLSKEEQQELEKHLEIVCSLLRKSYIKSNEGNKNGV